MNKRIILIPGLLVSILAILWFGRLLGSRKHETGDSPSTFKIALFDERSKTFLVEREAKWSLINDDNFVFSDFMRATGLVPSVRSLTNLLASPTPEYIRWKLYRWLRPRQAIGANGLATMKEALLELATLNNTSSHLINS